MTEDERVRTAEQERDSRTRGKKKDGKTGAREKKGDDGAARERRREEMRKEVALQAFYLAVSRLAR